MISQEKMTQIEERVNNMSTNQLSNQMTSLISEAQNLQEEQESSQSPTRQKAIATRLSEINAELSAIQKVLVIVVGASAISAITDDDKKDMLPPVVTLSGASTLSVELGSAFTDPGASATDLKDGALSVSVSGTVDTSTVGSYTLTYSATDAAGNSASATRTVNVVDTTAPVITVTGGSPTSAELDVTYTDAGATASDASGSISVTSSGTVDITTLGAYTITYTATDASGNVGTATRTVNVVDTTAPTVTVTGANPATVELDGTYTDLGATVVDASDTPTSAAPGTLAAVKSCTETYLNQNGDPCVDAGIVGTYTITYTATDASGNVGTATRTVNVVDTTAPTVTVTGANPATVELDGTYTDLGATVVDASDTPTSAAPGTLAAVKSCTETYLNQNGDPCVDAGIVGTYTITYTATDASGNVGTATRTVNVVDTTAPVFTSSASFNVDENTTYIGFVSVDQSTIATRGEVTFTIDSSEITIGSTSAALNFVTAPDYESNGSGALVYTAVVTATDANSNASTQTITVSVNDVGGSDDDTGLSLIHI